MRRRTRELVPNPRDHPRQHQRIAFVVHTGAQVQQLRPGDHGRQQREHEEHRGNESRGRADTEEIGHAA
jgi:hypothetical protein